MKIQEKASRIGLALSGGGARGFAFPGILCALEEAGIKPAAISAVSAGAIIGALCAAGEPAREIYEEFRQIKVVSWKNLFLPGRKLIDQQKLKEWLEERLEGKNFEELEIPLTISATNLRTGKLEYFNSGPIAEKIIASAALPLSTNPVWIGNNPYMDGGLLDNMPVQPLQQDCDFIIGINVNPLPESSSLHNIKDISERIFQVLIYNNANKNKSLCDLWIEPEFLKEYSFFGFNKKEELFEKAYHYLKEWLRENIGKIPL